MKPIFISFLIVFMFVSTNLFSLPPAYAFRVKFKDKNGTLTFADSLQFLTQKSLDRRTKQGISLDSSDLPVVPAYINQVMDTAIAVKLHNVSKWFNQIVVITLDSSRVTNIAALPMVDTVILVALYPNGIYKTDITSAPNKFPEVSSSLDKKTRGTSAHYGQAFTQIDIMQGDFLHDKGFKGEGIDIAVFDVNFRFANTCPCFDSMNLASRVKDIHNFARDTPYVYSMAIGSDHGMNVLGCMAANIPGTYVGTAPNANFYLYITEDILSEQPIEEDNWLSAAERADSLGVYMINSSLGYNYYNSIQGATYTYSDMDGVTTLIARAANKAVTKGIFVVNAQGNEGTLAWHYMNTPADADSVFSVGSVNGAAEWGLTGFGPTFDGRIKPDGLGMGSGAVLIGNACVIGSSNGSSFASPMVCGSIACLWQSAPTLTAFQLRRVVRMSCDRYNNIVNGVDTNHAFGYGIPNFQLACAIISGTSNVKNIDYTFSLYPNPSNGTFIVSSYDPSITSAMYALYDLSGRLIHKTEKLSNANFRCTALEKEPSGEYILKISTNDNTYSTKITKQ